MFSTILRPNSDLAVSAGTWTKQNGASSYFGAVADVVKSPTAIAAGGGEIQIPAGKTGTVTLGIPANELPPGAQVQTLRVYAYIDVSESSSGSSLHLTADDLFNSLPIDDVELYVTTGAVTFTGWVDSGLVSAGHLPDHLDFAGSTSASAYITIRAAYLEVGYALLNSKLSARQINRVRRGKHRQF